MQEVPLQFQEFITKNLFSKLFGITVIVGLIPLLIFDKNTIVIAINTTIANSALDTFFIYYTDTALGGTFITLTIITLFFSIRKATIIGLSGILILILSFVCKQLLFQDFPRPTAEIPLANFTHLIPDFAYAKRFSFPSGHTMSAFGMAAVLSFVIQKKYIQVLLFIYAISIAFSRMYLLQHFYMDVFAGAIIGFISILTILYFSSYFEKIPDRGIFK